MQANAPSDELGLIGWLDVLAPWVSIGIAGFSLWLSIQTRNATGVAGQSQAATSVDTLLNSIHLLGISDPDEVISMDPEGRNARFSEIAKRAKEAKSDVLRFSPEHGRQLSIIADCAHEIANEVRQDEHPLDSLIQKRRVLRLCSKIYYYAVMLAELVSNFEYKSKMNPFGNLLRKKGKAHHRYLYEFEKMSKKSHQRSVEIGLMLAEKYREDHRPEVWSKLDRELMVWDY